MFQKIKSKFKNFITNKQGFSLVELIVVIAIMAVMAAVLAPALLGYVEKSRMQKDDSAMDEVVNAIQLSLADQEIYDEVLEHSVWDNVSCYIDKKDESQFSNCKVQLKAANGDKKEQYMFGDEARLLDETVYYAAGNMRGLTITWSPNESGDTYDFSKGILNKFVGRKTGLLSENPELYNRLRSVIGDKLDTTSQTYRNSDYTIFIRVGSTGGAEAVMQDAVQVWGQFNGTNLAEKDHKYELSSGRVVGTAGANDAANNQNNNENGNMDFSEEVASLKEMSIDSVVYKYVDGMTWDEWVNSKYNTDEYSCSNGGLILTSDKEKSLRYNYPSLMQTGNSWSALYELNHGNYSANDNAFDSHNILPVDYSTYDKWEGSLDGTEYSVNRFAQVIGNSYYLVFTNSNVTLYDSPSALQSMSIDNISYYYEDGMTWKDWQSSKYCTINNFSIYNFISNNERTDLAYGPDTWSYDVRYGWCQWGNDTVSKLDKIFPTSYYFLTLTGWDCGCSTPQPWSDGYIYVRENGITNRYLPSELPQYN